MKKLLRDFLDIPATERRGIMALVLLILLVQSFRLLYPRLLGDTYPLSEAEARRFAEWVIRHDTSLGIRFKSEAPQISAPDHLFNPNTMDKAGWQKLGFTEREAASALKFISRGGKFRIRSDLQKLYFIDPEEYHVLEPWIDLPTAFSGSPIPHPAKSPGKARQNAPTELNRADTLALQQVRGIGPYWARRIVKQRDRLGGFYKLEQLLEMKGFTDSMFSIIRPQLRLDTNLIRKMALNSMHDTDLVKHPYCWYGVGKSIVTYRAKHGPFRDAGDLRKIIAIRPEQLERLLPYLKFE